MLNIRPFQIVLLGTFAMFAVGGVIFFILYSNSPSSEGRNYGERVTVWGTLDSRAVNSVFTEVINTYRDFEAVVYTQKDPANFELELLGAIAEGNSPDLIILPSDAVVSYRDKLSSIPYDTYSERQYRDTFIDGTEIFLFDEGIYGLPFAVDPLVMYWNRDLFASNGLAGAPRTWAELIGSVVPALTRTSSNFSLTQSAVAFGEYANIRNAKAIIAMLFLQSGTPIVTERDRRYSIMLQQGGSTSGLPPAEAALSFYTGFALPSAAQYSWSRSLPEDRLQFTGGKLGIYFGYGSEYPQIERSNPNLNFDVATVPQDPNATVRRDFGRFYAFAIPRAAGNPQGAYAVAQTLGEGDISAALATELDLAPVHRATLASGSIDPYRQVLYSAALIARAWLDPNPASSDNVFRTMVEDVTSGRSRISEAVNDAAGRLELLFR